MSAQYGFAYHKGLAEGVAIGKASTTPAAAEAANTALITGIFIGAAAVVTLFGLFFLIDKLAKFIGEGLADA